MSISIKDLLKCSKNIRTELISSNDINWVTKVSGEYKEMNNNEKGFNNTQIKQLVSIIKEVIHQEVPKMINELVPPIIDQKLLPINERLDRIEMRLSQIENCPTIKREL